MNPMFRKLMYFSFGALTMTREKAEKFFNEMVEKGEMSKEEAKTFIDETIKKGEEQKSEVREMVKAELEKVKNELSLVKRSDVELLEARIAELEKKLNEN